MCCARNLLKFIDGHISMEVTLGRATHNVSTVTDKVYE